MLDVAVEGEGFFSIQGPSETLYTRNGTFHISEDGTLVGTHGMPILGNNGPIQIPNGTTESQIVISKTGEISVDGQNVGTLELVAFEDPLVLQQVGTTLFSAQRAQVKNIDVQVQQGVKEQSNVSPVDEMVSMILAMRYYEASQRTLKTIDDAVEQQTSPRG